MAREFAEHVRLKFEDRSCRRLERFDGEPPPVGEIDLEVLKPEADRHRCDRRHAHAERRREPVFYHQRVHGVRYERGVFCHKPETKSL